MYIVLTPPAPLNATLTVKLTAAEKATIAKAAKAAGQTMSAYARARLTR